MSKRLKLIIGSVLLIMIAGIMYILHLKNQSDSILESFFDFRSIKTNEERALMSYYESLDILDSLKQNQEFEKSLIYIDSMAELGIFKYNLPLLEKSKIFYEIGEFEIAKEGFSKILRLTENQNEKALVWRSYCFIELNMCDSAVNDITKAYNKNKSLSTEYNYILRECK